MNIFTLTCSIRGSRGFLDYKGEILRQLYEARLWLGWHQRHIACLPVLLGGLPPHHVSCPSTTTQQGLHTNINRRVELYETMTNCSVLEGSMLWQRWLRESQGKGCTTTCGCGKFISWYSRRTKKGSLVRGAGGVHIMFISCHF